MRHERTGGGAYEISESRHTIFGVSVGPVRLKGKGLGEGGGDQRGSGISHEFESTSCVGGTPPPTIHPPQPNQSNTTKNLTLCSRKGAASYSLLLAPDLPLCTAASTAFLSLATYDTGRNEIA
jgi:hypothetical protein